jgi:hypothetical protein
MNSLTDLQHANEQAEHIEWQRLVARLNELECILGLHQTKPAYGSWEYVRGRIQRLACNAALRIHPDDNETQSEPIILGDWQAEQARSKSPFWHAK